MTYVRQAATLSRSLDAAGYPRLTIFTNQPTVVRRELGRVQLLDGGPEIVELEEYLEVPHGVAYRGAHYKLDMIAQAGRYFPADTLVMVLDSDVVALRAVPDEIVDRIAHLELGVYDTTDTMMATFGVLPVVAELERIAGRRLARPRWFGGEFLIGTPARLTDLAGVARGCVPRYLAGIEGALHQGDEAFVSAALNLSDESGRRFVECGAIRVIVRHEIGNPYRSFKWDERCDFVHVPGNKSLLERWAVRPFGPQKFIRQLRRAHVLGRYKWRLKFFMVWAMRRPSFGDPR